MEFASPLLLCGSVESLDSAIIGKEHFHIGVGKLSDRLSPLQAQQVLDCRQQVGIGVAVEWSEEGEVYLQCLARRPVFVASAFLDREAMRAGTDCCTHVIYQRSTIQVHDLYQCASQMDLLVREKGVDGLPNEDKKVGIGLTGLLE